MYAQAATLRADARDSPESKLDSRSPNVDALLFDRETRKAQPMATTKDTSRIVTEQGGRGARQKLGAAKMRVAVEEIRRKSDDLAVARLAAENALREGEVLRQTLEEHSIVSVADASGRIVSVNDAFCAISGYTREELLGQDHRIINSGTHPKSFWVGVWRKIATGQAWRGEVCNRAKDGSLYWVDSIIAPFRGPRGTIEKYVSIRNDITERRQHERALRESAQRLGLAAKIANIGVWDWDLLTGGVRWDRNMFEIYGTVPTVDSIVSYEDWTAALVPEDLEAQEAILRDTVKRCGRSEREFRIRRPDGSIRVVQSAETVLPDERGTPILVVGVNRDVTHLRESERRLTESLSVIARQNAELSALAERAHRVVDDVSHEFRTPLAAIKEFASIIADGLAGPVSEEQSEYLRIVDGAVVDLNHMVEDLLDSSKLRSGRLRVDRGPHRVCDIITTGRPALARKASARCIVVEECFPDSLPTIFVDEEKVRRVIGNLLTNAIKFSPEGDRVILSAQIGPRHGEVTISVTDHGPGLSPEDTNRLFGRFQQVSTSRTVAAKGFGLGLSIAQELSWLNLGRLTVSSEKGRGATFSFTVPVNEPGAVLAHYFETVLELEALGGTELALLRVDAAPAAQGTDPDEPRAFLASATYATDLVLPVPWNRDAGPARSWWVLGQTKSAEAWATRLRAERARLISDTSVRLAALNVECRRVWPGTAAGQPILAEVTHTLAIGAPDAQ